MKVALFVILGALATYLFLGTLLFLFQRSFIYFPTPELSHPYAIKSLDTGGEVIELVVLNPGQSNALLYFGGNAESVVANAEHFLNLFQWHTVYLVNYRGYGGSTGSPSEQALFSDAAFVYEKLHTEHAGISVMGRSLGSGVATYLAANKQVDKLILVTPFDSVQNVAADIYPIFPISWLLKDKYDSLKRVPDIQA